MRVQPTHALPRRQDEAVTYQRNLDFDNLSTDDNDWFPL